MEEKDDDLQYSGFFRTLKDSQKYKELIFSFEGIISIALSIITTHFLFLIYYQNNISDFNTMIRNITLNLSVGYMSLLGFVIAGLALTSGTTSMKSVDNIKKENKFKKLVSIFFSFAFLGFIIVLSLIVLLFIHLCSYIVSMYVTNLNLMVISLLSTYLFWFSILYSIGLLGTCINIFILNYSFYKDKQVDSNMDSMLNYKSLAINNALMISTMLEVMKKKGIVTHEVFDAEFNKNFDGNFEEMKKKLDGI